MVEMAIVLLLFLTLVFGMLDLGLGVYRFNELSQAAREVAREAVVHGEYADKLGPWGPETFGPMSVQEMIDNTNADEKLEEMETEIVAFLGPFVLFFRFQRSDRYHRMAQCG